MADQAGRGGGGGIGRNPVGILRQRAAPLEAGWVLAASLRDEFEMGGGGIPDTGVSGYLIRLFQGLGIYGDHSQAVGLGWG